MEQAKSMMEQEPFLRKNSLESAKLYAGYDAERKKRVYSENFERVLYGRYDDRGLLQVLREDGVVYPDDLNDAEAYFDRFWEQNEQIDCYMRLHIRAGGYHLFRILLTSFLRDNGLRDRVAVLIDAEQEHTLHRRLQFLSEYDPTTAIYNQYTFYAHAAEIIRDAAPGKYVIIRTNFEKFKIINDLFGLERGDALLCRMARLGDELAEKVVGKCVFGRIRADIFACCCENTQRNIDLIMDYTRREVRAFLPDYEVRADFGLYVVDDPALPVDLMVDRANMAMETIRGNYLKNYAYFDQTIRRAVLHEQFIVGEMAGALRDGQFSIVIQPKCDMDTGRVTGGEVLTRWNHPTHGAISPAAFIPVFEKSHFIFRLDAFVWEQACRELRRELDEGIEALPLSVNLSRVDIQNDELLETLRRLIEQYDIPLELFSLEITESGDTPDDAEMLRTVGMLHDYGFEILLDDFGSAYSTFNVLNGTELGALKIDLRSLSARSLTTRRVVQLLTSFVFMADQLGIPTVIEGVETQEQVDCAREAGIRCAQGYFYYRPLPPDEYRALLDKT